MLWQRADPAKLMKRRRAGSVMARGARARRWAGWSLPPLGQQTRKRAECGVGSKTRDRKWQQLARAPSSTVDRNALEGKDTSFLVELFTFLAPF